MGTRLALVIALGCGCGRIGFDAHAPGDGAIADGRSADGTPGDGAGSDTNVSTIVLVQMGPVTPVTGDIQLGLPAASQPGTLLVAAFATNTSTFTAPTGWSIASQNTLQGSCTAAIAYYPANPGGITSATFTQLAGNPAVGQLTEWSGVTGFDVEGTISGVSPVTSQVVQTSGMTQVAGELAISTFCEDANNPTYTESNGWTALGTYTNVSSSPSFASNYQRGEPIGVVGDAVTSSVAGKYAAVIATFRP